MSHTQKHRHFVAAPIALLAMMAITLLHTALPAGATAGASIFHTVATIPLHGPVEMDAPTGVHFSLSAQSDLLFASDGAQAILKKGSVLIDAQGYAAVRSGCLSVEMLRSAAYIDASETDVTVAAVVGPLLVDPCSKGRRFVSEGSQFILHADGTFDIAHISPQWLWEKREAVRRSVAAPVSLPLSSMSPHSSLADQSVLLASLLRSPATLQSTDLEAVFTMTDSIDSDGLSLLASLVLLPDIASFDRPGQQMIVRALRFDGPFRSALLTAVVDILLAHPFSLPENVHTSWLNAQMEIVSMTPKQSLITLRRLQDLPALMGRSGFPKQEVLWRTHLLELSAVLHPLLLDKDQQSLESVMQVLSDRRADDQTQHKELPAAVSSSHASVASISLPVLIAKTKAILLMSDALITSDATFDADENDPHSVRVSGVLLSDGVRDVSYQFSYAPERNLIHHIVREGTPLPNALTPDQFFSH